MPIRLLKSFWKPSAHAGPSLELALQRLQARIDALEDERLGLFGLSGEQFSGLALKFSCGLAEDAQLVLDHASSSATAWLGATPAALAQNPLLALEPLAPAAVRRLQRRWLVSRKRLQPFSELVSLDPRGLGLRWLQVQVMPARCDKRLVWECLALDVTALQAAHEAQETALREQLVFLSSLNARLRTPLNAISGYVQLMQQPGGEKAGAQARGMADLGHIGQGCEQLTEILDEVLDTTALALGTLQLADDELSFGPWLHALASNWQHNAADRGLQFSLESSNCEHVVRTDRKRLGQVLRRLFFTTIASARPGEVRVHSACQHQADRLHVTVAITLVPPAHETQQAAAASWGADTILNRSDDALALTSPLAWAQQMARRLGGSVGTALSDDGSFTLQLRISLPLAAPTPATPDLLKPLHTLSILVVDDSLTNRLILKRFLESRGHAVREADNGRAAVEAVTVVSPDLVFMDIDMPEMDGCEATRTIRRLVGRAAGVPICAMTGLSFDQDRDRARASGMNHFISKPVNFSIVQKICALTARDLHQEPVYAG